MKVQPTEFHASCPWTLLWRGWWYHR